MNAGKGREGKGKYIDRKWWRRLREGRRRSLPGSTPLTSTNASMAGTYPLSPSLSLE